jgi:squalene synthase HpnC
VSLLAGDRAEVPSAAAVMARAGGENFPVASRLLPRRARAHLLAIYGYARLVDELGDSYAGDREEALGWLESELDRAFRGEAKHPLMIRLAATLHDCSLPRGPFVRLIEANRMDQRTTRYDTWEQLRAYCALSADPVGELVLAVFGKATPELVALADSVCTGLQLTEHLQDVAEDLAAGRIYLPLEDMERFSCTEADLRTAHAGPALRALIGFEVERARRLLDAGVELARRLRGRERLAIAGFAGGGHAALGAIARSGFDVLPGPPRAGRARQLLAAAELLRAAGRRAQ